MAQTAIAESDTSRSLSELARRHGLSSASALPSLPAYVRQLWAYRYFTRSYANAKVSSALGSTWLGMFWQVLTPLFNAAVYYLIFGFILNTRGPVDNFLPYLCTGVFIYSFTQSVVQNGVTAISGNLGLIRALHFPRASLPLAVAIVEIRNLVASISVLLVIVYLTGEPIRLQWLLIFPALFLQAVFNAGLGMFVARLGSTLTDLKQLIPFIMRIWMYTSAVLFSVTKFTEKFHGTSLKLIEANPLLVYIELIRHALLTKAPVSGPLHRTWIEAVIWAVLAGTGGLLYFWRGEKGYGRG